MTKSNGIKSLKQAAKLLNKHAPDGESLAYINPEEARLLKSHGGSGIMTLHGVPTYGPLDWFTTNIYDPYIKPAAEWLGYSGDEGGGRLLKDVTSLGGAYVGYKEAEELSDFQKKQYEEAKAQELLNQLKFAQESGQGEQLLAPQNVPSKIEDVSRFTEVDIPTMTTTAAQGGRIGYNLGGIDTPFQGIGALNPRMGYANGMGPHWDVPTFSEGVEQMYESGPTGVNETIDESVSFEPGAGWGTLQEEISGKPHLEQNDLIVQKAKEFLSQLKSMRDKGLIPESLNDQDLLKIAFENLSTNYLSEGLAHGGRIGAQGGGIMPLLNMGGMEKDYRQDGGFVPIGRKEKADDVPARLSKNEFVFTADAVKAAGGGDIDEGAQRMYNVMKNLEAGGQISEQSQGKA